MNEEYEREIWNVKIKQVLDRQLCHFRGLQKSLLHNSQIKRSSKILVKEKKVKTIPKKKTCKNEFVSKEQKPIQKKWTPSTTKNDIEKILKSKKLKIKSRHLPCTKLKIKRSRNSKDPKLTSHVVPNVLKVGDTIPWFDGTCTLQRFIHKTGRWRVKLENGEVQHLKKEAIDFLFSCENECDLKFESLNMETILEAADEVKKSLNNSCYVLIIQKILMILKDNIEFNFDLLYDVAISQNIDEVFDDLEKMDIRVIDNILNVYDLQLKYFCPSKIHCDDIEKELLKMYEEPVYLSVLWYKNHYYLLGKWDNNFFLYDPLQKFPIRCYYRDVIEFISEENVKFFWVQDLDYSYRLSDWLGVQESVKGGVKKKRRLNDSDNSSDDNSSDKDQPKKRQRITSPKSQNDDSLPKKRKRVSMKGWTEEQKKEHRKKLQKIRNDKKNPKRKKKPFERKYANRKEMPQKKEKKRTF